MAYGETVSDPLSTLVERARLHHGESVEQRYAATGGRSVVDGEVAGFWWPAGSDGRKSYGTLGLVNGALTLALSEWFDPASPHAIVDLLVHGVDDSGGQHSLLGCFQTSLVASSGLPAFPQRWHVDAHLAGAHLAAAHEPALAMRVDIPSLLSWSGLGALTATESDGSVAVAGTRQSLGVGVVDGHRIELYVDQSVATRGDSLIVNRSAHFGLTFAADRPMTLAAAFQPSAVGVGVALPVDVRDEALERVAYCLEEPQVHGQHVTDRLSPASPSMVESSSLDQRSQGVSRGYLDRT